MPPRIRLVVVGAGQIREPAKNSIGIAPAIASIAASDDLRVAIFCGLDQRFLCAFSALPSAAGAHAQPPFELGALAGASSAKRVSHFFARRRHARPPRARPSARRPHENAQRDSELFFCRLQLVGAERFAMRLCGPALVGAP